MRTWASHSAQVYRLPMLLAIGCLLLVTPAELLAAARQRCARGLHDHDFRAALRALHPGPRLGDVHGSTSRFTAHSGHCSLGSLRIRVAGLPDQTPKVVRPTALVVLG